MLLIGQYDLPFVRRVAVTLKLYDLPCRHAPLSAFGDVEEIARYNPLRRVPTLVFDDGVALTDSSAIVDAIDEMVGPHRSFLAPRRRSPGDASHLRLRRRSGGEGGQLGL